MRLKTFFWLGVIVCIVVLLIFINMDTSDNVNNPPVFPEPFRGKVHVWGKAAIGEYFWMHIFEGELNVRTIEMFQTHSLTVGGIMFSYSTGAAVNPASVNRNARSAVVILNGREREKVEYSKHWLMNLTDKTSFPNLVNLGIVILGNEQCNNTWLIEFCENHRPLIKLVFVVYDINHYFVPAYFQQWPLGVATYRNFPFVRKTEVDVFSKRKYKCNFLGTVYSGSSREKLVKILSKPEFERICYTSTRTLWPSLETAESMESYKSILQQSDLTLCPVGKNSETYRIYEAMSYGSIPVVEDVTMGGQCGGDYLPYQLMNMLQAPVIYVSSWDELDNVMKDESALSDREIIERRQFILEWYEMFRFEMRDRFLNVLQETFE